MKKHNTKKMTFQCANNWFIIHLLLLFICAFFLMEMKLLMSPLKNEDLKSD